MMGCGCGNKSDITEVLQLDENWKSLIAIRIKEAYQNNSKVSASRLISICEGRGYNVSVEVETGTKKISVCITPKKIKMSDY